MKDFIVYVAWVFPIVSIINIVYAALFWFCLLLLNSDLMNCAYDSCNFPKLQREKENLSQTHLGRSSLEQSCLKQRDRWSKMEESIRQIWTWLPELSIDGQFRLECAHREVFLIRPMLSAYPGSACTTTPTPIARRFRPAAQRNARPFHRPSLFHYSSALLGRLLAKRMRFRRRFYG